MQLSLDAHQPHSRRAVQSLQFGESKQGSTPVHSEENHAQLPQLPLSGPLELPDEQAPVSPHQPQGYSPVQLPQSVWVEHVSGVEKHSIAAPFQSEQLPEVGPPDVPGSQLPPPSAHQPQPEDPVHPLQSVAVQVGVPPPQALGNQSQSPQDPVSGPEDEPVPQLPLPSPHQPQG